MNSLEQLLSPEWNLDARQRKFVEQVLAKDRQKWRYRLGIIIASCGFTFMLIGMPIALHFVFNRVPLELCIKTASGYMPTGKTLNQFSASFTALFILVSFINQYALWMVATHSTQAVYILRKVVSHVYRDA